MHKSFINGYNALLIDGNSGGDEFTYQSFCLCSPKFPASQEAHEDHLLLGAIVRLIETERSIGV